MPRTSAKSATTSTTVTTTRARRSRKPVDVVDVTQNDGVTHYVSVVELIEPENIVYIENATAVAAARMVSLVHNEQTEYHNPERLVHRAQLILAQRKRALKAADKRCEAARTREAETLSAYLLMRANRHPFDQTAAAIIIDKFEAEYAYDDAMAAYEAARQRVEDAQDALGGLLYRLRNYDDHYVLHPTIPTAFRPRVRPCR